MKFHLTEKELFEKNDLLDNGKKIKRKEIKQEMRDLMDKILRNYRSMDDAIGYYTGKKKFTSIDCKKRYEKLKNEKSFLEILLNLRKQNIRLTKEYLSLEGLII